MFIACYTQPEVFFHPNGVAKVNPSPATIGTGQTTVHESAPGSAGKNARTIIEKKFDYIVTNKYAHTCYPQNRLIAQQIEKENKQTL